MIDNISRESIRAAREIYSVLGDEESKRIFLDKLLFSVTGENKYWHDILNYRNEDVILRLHELVNSGKKVIVYGAGTNCEPTIDICQNIGVDIYCICDKDEGKQGQLFCGKEVISPEQLVQNHKDAVVIISTIRYSKEAEEFLLKHFVRENVIDISGAKLKDLVDAQYFPEEDIFTFADGEVFVDGGCFDFETSRFLMERCRVKHIYAFEPDKMNLEKVKEQIRTLGISNVTVFDKGLWNGAETLYFSSTGDIMSHVVDSGDDEDKIAVVALDEVIQEEVTFIKMDIEGSELKALEGAKNLIQTYKPKLAICIYHKPEDTIDIPFYIKKLVPEYKLYIRHYSWSPAETVLYATL